MGIEEEERARVAGIAIGEMKAKMDNAMMRIARLEAGVIAAATAVAVLYAKSVGLW